MGPEDPVVHLFHHEAESLDPFAPVIHVTSLELYGIRARNMALACSAMDALGASPLTDQMADSTLSIVSARMERFVYV